MTVADAPFDAGLQPERSLLAWRRTCLSIGVGGLLFIRFATPEVGPIAVALSLLGLVLAALAYIDSARRYRRAQAHLTSGRVHPSPAVPVTLVAASVAVFAVACGVWLVVVAG